MNPQCDLYKAHIRILKRVLFAGGACTGVEVNRNLNSHRKSVDVHFVPRHLGLGYISLGTR